MMASIPDSILSQAQKLPVPGHRAYRNLPSLPGHPSEHTETSILTN